MGAKVAFHGIDAGTDAPGPAPTGVTVARDALHADAGGDYVWRLTNDVVERREIEVGGARSGERVLVVRGLAAGDTVVRSSERALTAGQKIRRN
jgi:multidrug efflux pump subunit AcrA (membrane-fusion protein)